MANTEEAVKVPGLNHVPEEWVEELSRAAQWAAAGVSGPEESGAVRYGVLQGDPASRWLTAVSSVLWEGITTLQPGTSMTYITYEKYATWLGNMNRQPTARTTGGADARLELKFESFQSVHLRLQSQGEGSVEGGGSRQVVFVLEVDSTYSAGFAVALLTIATWSRWATTRASAPKRVVVLLVSVGDLHKTIRNVLDDACQGSVQEFVLPALSEGMDRLNFVQLDWPEVSELFGRVAETASDTERHCIILFEGAADVVDVGNLGCIPSHAFKWWDNAMTADLFVCGGRPIVVLQVPLGFHAPYLVEGFTHLHLVTDTQRAFTKVRDVQTDQIVSLLLEACVDELKEQLSWAFKVDCPRENVTVYQNPGLVQANLDEMRVTACLEEPLGRAFHGLLRLFDYDPRLAMFVALPCENMAVQAIKIQFAALQMVGVDQVFPTLRFGNRCDDERQFDIFAGCIGLTRGIAMTGTIWALLGFWKRAIRDSVQFHGVENKLYKLIPGRGVNRAPTQSAHEIGYPVRTDESNYIAHREMDELREQLLRCYHSQVAVATVPNEYGSGAEDQAEAQYQDLATQSPFVMEGGLNGLINFPAITQSGPNEGTPFGVYTGLARTDTYERTFLRDWIWIPQGTWNAWTLPNCRQENRARKMTGCPTRAQNPPLPLGTILAILEAK
ncbi:hypothetical protein ACCO45_006480 [Purpureocillium lilacinum]|uniref:Uncharacterized protein n=1 Tax=Purpureocillium lilacinum TaxID=33203 RepID=A0ACC4DQB5_PURLI